MKKVIILSGPSGSGKSTWATRNYPDATICSADTYFVDVDTGEYNFDPTKLPEAHAACMSQFLELLHLQVGDIVVDNTNIQIWERQNYELAAIYSNWAVHLVFFAVDTVKQIKKCYERNQHGVPLDVIGRQAIAHVRFACATTTCQQVSV